VAWLLAAAYSLYIDRDISPDETGLYNPIYTFVETGRMTYPLHGQPEFMTVHPPTHYLILGLLTKLGLSLFTAATVPILILFAVLIAAAATGRLSLTFALAAVLGCFSANLIWADYVLVRPDLHLTMAWFTGLVLLEAARNQDWSPVRLAAGTALSVYAATLHYWGIAALAGPVVYAIALAFDARRTTIPLRSRIIAIVGGGLAVGLPFLLGFVIPLWDPIREMLGTVQGGGGVAAAVQRHMAAYDGLSVRLANGWQTRTIVTILTVPILAWHVPAVLVAGVALWCLRHRVFATAGLALPAFVLLASQGKATTVTFYLTPEMTLYLTAAFATCFAALRWLAASSSRLGRVPAYAAGMSVIVATLSAVPNSSGSTWRWTRSLYDMESLRAAAFRIVGNDALVGMVSLAPWYTSGGHYAWYATNDLTEVNQSGGDVAPLLDSADAFAIDGDWWHALPNLAPIGAWYVEGRLSLTGFVLPTNSGGRNQFTLFVSRQKPDRIRGYFFDADGIRMFEQRDSGGAVFSVWQCPGPVDGSRFPDAFYKYAFHYDQTPSPSSRTLLLTGSTADAFSGVERAAGGLNCHTQDVVRGDLSPIKSSDLISALRKEESYISVSTTLSEAIAATRRGSRTNTPDTQKSLAIVWDQASIQTDARNQSSRRLPVLIRPPAVRWAYGGVLPLDVPHDGSKALLFDVKARILEGTAGFGLLNEKQDAFVSRAFRPSSNGTVTVSLLVPARTKFGPLVVQNGGTDKPTLVELQDVHVSEVEPRSRSLRPASQESARE